MTLLRTAGLGRRYGGVAALSDVDFAVTAGEIRAVIGPNGAGKTTLSGLLAGRIRPTAGRIFLADRDITRLPPWRRARLGIASGFQVSSLFPGLSCRQTVLLAARTGARRQGGGESAAEIARAALDRTGLTHRAETRAGALSHGHRRLLEIAMGLALRPSLLILDEPAQGLTEAETASLCALIREMAGSVTVLLIEHNMPMVMALAGRITVMDQGRILASGAPETIRADARVRAVYPGV